MCPDIEAVATNDPSRKPSSFLPSVVVPSTFWRRQWRPAERAQKKVRSANEVQRRRLEDAREAAQNQDAALEAVCADIKRANQKWKAVSARTWEARSFLCREAAGLYGLRLKRRRSGRVEYMIGGVVLPNLLTDLNGAFCPGARLWWQGG